MNKLSLIKPSICPRDGFRYVFPEDGFTAHAWTYQDWVNVAKDHLTANNKEVPANLEELMQDQLCQTLDYGWCNYDDANRPRVSTSMDWSDVMGALNVFKEWVLQGRGFVDQAEAERRATICSKCFYNTHVGGCAACQKLVAEVAGKRQTKLDHALKACAVCHCVLKVKVHFKQNVLDVENKKMQEVFPEFCWNKIGGSNYRG